MRDCEASLALRDRARAGHLSSFLRTLRFGDGVRSESSSTWVRAVQQLLDWITVRTVADHLVLDPFVDLKELGFKIDRVERLKWGTVERAAARKPG